MYIYIYIYIWVDEIYLPILPKFHQLVKSKQKTETRKY